LSKIAFMLGALVPAPNKTTLRGGTMSFPEEAVVNAGLEIQAQALTARAVAMLLRCPTNHSFRAVDVGGITDLWRTLPDLRALETRKLLMRFPHTLRSAEYELTELGVELQAHLRQ
jgi:hypothetical protein